MNPPNTPERPGTLPGTRYHRAMREIQPGGAEPPFPEAPVFGPTSETLADPLRDRDRLRSKIECFPHTLPTRSSRPRQTQEKESGNGEGYHRGRRPPGKAVSGIGGRGGHRVHLHLGTPGDAAETGSTGREVAALRDGRRENRPRRRRRDHHQAGGTAVSHPGDIAEAGEPSLLGVVSLEQAALAVDPLAGRLIPANLLRL